MGKSWIRKDQEGVSPVIGTILMVAITVVLAAVLYAMVIPPSPPSAQPMVGLTKQVTGDRWSLMATSVQGKVPLSATTLTIRNQDGVVMYPMSAVPLSELTQDNWNNYKVLYQKQKAGDSVMTPGSTLILDMATYEKGCSYVLVLGDSIIASGTL